MKKVLIIDDEDALRRTLVRAATAFGYEVKDAGDGRTGIHVCADWKPDVIVTDIFMPEQDGIELITKLRQEQPTARIIAMSGGGEIGHMDVLRVAKAMGAAHVLAKPFALTELKKALEGSLPETDA